MTRKSKYVATTFLPRVHGAAEPGSNLECILDAVRLGHGSCRVVLSTPNGETFRLLVEYEGGANTLHSLPETEQ